jgi:hypothetical protein
MPDIFDYVLKNFNTNFAITPGEFEISYGIDNKSRIQIWRNDNGYFDKNEPLNLNDPVWKEWNSISLPFLFDSSDTQSIISFNNNMVIINYDIIASSFFLLSNWQEYVCHKKDNHGRFLYSESIQQKLNITGKPVVNYYFDILKHAIQTGYNVELKNSLWGSKKFSVCVTHDIDLCESAWLQGSYREIRKGKIFSPFKLIAQKIFAEDECIG